MGSSEPAKRRIVRKGKGAEQAKTVQEPLSGHCPFRGYSIYVLFSG
jgi:hypothetical protein